MLKAKRILRDLKHNLKGKKRVFNYYDVAHNCLESKNLAISLLDIVRALAPYEVDFKKLYGVDFEDVLYNDAQGNYTSLDLDYEDAYRAGNSYNWNSQVVYNFNDIQVIDKYGVEHVYTVIKFHRYGDVRGNYTESMILKIDGDEFLETIMDATSVYVSINYKGNTYSIGTDCYKESCLFDIYNQTTGEDFYDACLDIDNYRSLKDIKKGLIKYLKEQDAIPA